MYSLCSVDSFLDGQLASSSFVVLFCVNVQLVCSNLCKCTAYVFELV